MEKIIMRLLGTSGSPYVRKVRLVLEEKHIPHEFVIARPSLPESRVAEFNPLGKIPVLVRDDGRALYDSPVIVEYLDGLVPEPRLIPQSFEGRIEVKRWEALGDGVADAAVDISHDYREPEGKRKSVEWYEKQQLKIERGLATMSQDLGQRRFCFGDSFTLADIAAGYALGYLDQALPRVEWRSRFGNLHELAERLAQRDSFKKTVPVPA
jgi:glutathione S-transferase